MLDHNCTKILIQGDVQEESNGKEEVLISILTDVYVVVIALHENK